VRSPWVGLHTLLSSVSLHLSFCPPIALRVVCNVLCVAPVLPCLSLRVPCVGVSVCLSPCAVWLSVYARVVFVFFVPRPARFSPMLSSLLRTFCMPVICALSGGGRGGGGETERFVDTDVMYVEAPSLGLLDKCARVCQTAHRTTAAWRPMAAGGGLC